MPAKKTRAQLFAPLGPALLGVLGLGACGAGPAVSPAATVVMPADEVHLAPNRPPLALVPREGDPSAALAIAVSTEGLLASRAPEVTLAVASLVEERLRPVWPALESRPGFEGFELRGLVTEQAVDALVMAIDRAMQGPASPTELELVRRKLATLAKKPLPDPALRELARCRGEVFSLSRGAELSLADLEAWRAGASAIGRVAFAVVGSPEIMRRTAAAVSRMNVWPTASGANRTVSTTSTSSNGTTDLVEAPGLVPSRVARAHVILRSTDAARAVAGARALGAPASPLIARLGGLDGAPRIEEISGTAGLAGGCVSVSLDFGTVDLAAPATISRLSTALALVGQEAVEQLAETGPSPALGRTLARQAADPREAAERAAWWTLLATSGTPDKSVVAREEAGPRAVVVYGPAKDKPTPPEAAKNLDAAVRAVATAFQKPVVTSKARVERGQAELWMLFASPCGTAAEVAADAGLASAFARASVEAPLLAGAGAGSVVLEPWIGPDAIGVIAHAPALAEEQPAAHARRVADAAARAFAANPIDERAAARVRAALRAHVNDPRPRALFTLAEAIAPGHPSWLVPEGNPDSLARVSVASLVARAAALREGPLRVAVLANVDDAQATSAARAVDRWITRRPEGVRACPMPNAAAAPRAGVYAVEAVGAHEAYLALPIGDAAQRKSAEWIAEALDGEGGLLSSVVIGGGLARGARARVVGGAAASALVVHVASTEGALDSAVAQVRALLERLRQGALTEAELAQAASRRVSREARASLDPRARLAALFSDKVASSTPPSLASLTTAAQSFLRDEALIVVALRPPRPRAQ